MLVLIIHLAIWDWDLARGSTKWTWPDRKQNIWLELTILIGVIKMDLLTTKFTMKVAIAGQTRGS